MAVPLALTDATSDEGQRRASPGHSWLPRPHPRNPRQGYSSYRRSGGSGRSRKRTGDPSTSFTSPGRRVHKPDPDEANADRAAVGCGWPGRPYATVLQAVGPTARRGFLPSLFPAGLEGCSEAVESSSGSSSRASGSSPSSSAAQMLRLVGRDSLVEFAAWAGLRKSSSLQGFRSPDGQSWLVCPRALRVNDRRVLLAMWRQARVHIDWLAEIRPGGRTPTIPFARWGPQWAQHSFQTGDSDDDPMFGRLPDEDLPEFAPTRRVLEWPVVPTSTFAPGTYSRRDYYLARLGPWARVVHFPRRQGEDDTVARCGRRIEGYRALAWPPPAAERGGLPWQWCRECWAGEYISRGDMHSCHEVRQCMLAPHFY